MTEVGRSMCSRLWPIPLTHVSCVLMAFAGVVLIDSIVQHPRRIRDDKVMRGGQQLLMVVSGLRLRRLCAPQATFLVPSSLTVMLKVMLEQWTMWNVELILSTFCFR